MKRKVLVVDDHPIVREGLAQMINRESDLMVCGDAEDMQRAVQLMDTLKPDILIVDISLNGPDGLDLLKYIRARDPALPVLILSMHDEALYAERALRAGAKGYVMKRESTKSVITAIRRVLSGEVYISERVVSAMAKRMGSSRKAAAEPVERLSDRELEIFRLLGQGRTTSQIAEDLHLSLKTVQAYCARAKEKFGVNSLGELLRAAIRWEDATNVK